MLKIYTKNSYIKKLENDLNKCLDDDVDYIELAFLDGYYDNKKENIRKKLIPFVIKFKN